MLLSLAVVIVVRTVGGADDVVSQKHEGRRLERLHHFVLEIERSDGRRARASDGRSTQGGVL